MAPTTLADLTGDPHPTLAALRATTPVAWVPVLDGWLVTSYPLAQRVMRDAVTYTVDDPRFSTATVVGPSMLSLDGPEHTRHRDPYVPPFRPAPVRDDLAPLVRAAVARRLDDLAPAGGAELRADFAGPLAVEVLAAAMGMADVDPAEVRTWYAALVESVSAVTAGGAPTAEGAAAYDAVKARVATSALAANSALAEEERAANTAVLMFGGIDTTESMLTTLVWHLLDHPAALAALRADRALLPGAIEESLRLEPAASVVDRYATRDVDLAGAAIRRGDLVRVSIAGANRDPSVFGDPDTFDPARPNAKANLAFALGPHFCLGARLAREEAATAVTALLDRFPALRLAAPTAPEGLVFRKPPALHVRWD